MILCNLLCLAAPLVQDVHSVRLFADLDNTLYESPTGSLSNGVGERLFAGLTQAGVLRRALVRFDLSSIPPAARIKGVSLHLNVSKVPFLPPTTNFQLHRVTAAWGEGTSDAPGEEGTGTSSTPGDATWLHRFFPSDFWTQPGGDFDPTVSAQTLADQNLGPISWRSKLGTSSHATYSKSAESAAKNASVRLAWPVVVTFRVETSRL